MQGAGQALAGAIHGPIRGRDEVLAQIGELLAGAAAGTGAVVVVDGAPGMGTSRVLSEARAMAGRNGFAVLDVQAEYDLGKLRARLGDPPGGPRVLVALDAADRAEPGVLGALRRLAPALRASPVVWVLAASTACAPARSGAVLGELLRQGAHRLRLGALDDEATRALVADLLDGAEAPAGLLDRVGRAAGNPWLVTELVRGVVDEGPGATHHVTAVPAGLRRAVRERLDRMPPATARLLQVASIIGPCAPEHAAAMLELSPAALLEPLQEALRAEVLVEADGELVFREPLLRDGVESTLPTSARRGLRRQAAEVLLTAGGDAAAVAEHLMDSAHRGDRHAIGTLSRAARELAVADPLRAADVAARALELTPRDDPAWAALVAETILLLQAALRDDEADALGAMALDGTLAPSDEAGVRLGLAALSRRDSASRIEHGLHALRTPGLEETLHARHLAALVQNLTAAGRQAEGALLLPRARVAADAAGDPLARATVRLADVELAELQGDVARAGELAGHGGPYRPGSIAVRAVERATSLAGARALGAAGDLEHALERAEAILARAALDGHRWAEALARSLRSRLLIDAGRPAAAVAEADEVMALCARPATGQADLGASLLAAEAALHLGDPARVKAGLDAARHGARDGDPAVRRQALRLLTLAAWAEGDAEEARRRLATAEAEDLFASLAPAQCPALVRVALATGRRGAAVAATRRAEAVAARAPSSAVCAAALAHCRALLGQDPVALVQAGDAFGSAGRPLHRAAVLDDASDALARSGRREDAARCARLAAELMEGCGALADLRRMRRRLRASGLDVRGATRSRAKDGWGSLTEAELEVTRLVAEGRTNRQVAERLILSPHTVSTHLRHAFTKLGINSRVELARIAMRAELEAA